MLDYIYGLATDKPRKGAARLLAVVELPLKALLCLLSFIYGLAVSGVACFWLHRSNRLNCKVISVGNITLGGTGKTSLVEYIAKYLIQRGRKVAVLTRGYKRIVSSRGSEDSSYGAMGDEAYMLHLNLKQAKVIVGPDRVRSAARAVADFGCDTVILDDGFQQWRIKKDLEIVTIDSLNPFGNRRLMPRGILRQPLSSLRRADVFVLTKANLAPDTARIRELLGLLNPGAGVFESEHRPAGFYRIDKPEPLTGTDALKGKTAALVSGIGEPASFELLVKSLGVNAGLCFRFGDHHKYSAADLENIMVKARQAKMEAVVTTEKDSVRLKQLPLAGYGLAIYVLRIELKIIRDEQGFCSRLLKLYNL